MSQSLSKNALYLDRYFPVQEDPAAQPQDASYIPEDYAGFDAAYAEDFEFGMETEAEARAAEAEANYDSELPEGPTPEQEKLLGELEQKAGAVEESYQEAQGAFEDLQDGHQDLKPEEKAQRLREIEETLAEIESDLQAYQTQEKKLKDSGLDEGDWANETAVDAEELEKGLEALKDNLGEEIEKTDAAAAEAAEAKIEAEAEAEDNKEAKEGFLDALGYLNGSKGERYFTAKVWGKKHIKDYHEDVTENASRIISEMADAVVSGDWDVGVAATIDTLSGGSADNTLALVYVILEKQNPELFKKIPSKILEAMSDAIRRGNSPGDRNIYYINQDGKYDGPKDDRRRKDMQHENISYAEAADRLKAHAESQRAAEEAEAEAEPDAESAGEEVPAE